MNKHNVIQFLAALGVTSPNVRREGWVRCPCPFSPHKHENHYKEANKVKKDPNFGIKISSGESHCYCFSCGTSGDLYSMITELQYLERRNPTGRIFDYATALQLIAEEGSVDALYGDLSARLKDNSNEGHDLIEFPESFLANFPKAYDDHGNIHPYLASRNLPYDLVRHFDVRYHAETRRVVFPIYGFNGKCYGLHGRAIDKTNELRYFAFEYLQRRNPSVWMNEKYIDFDEPIVLTEGQFDLASLCRVYPNVVASQTSALNTGKMKRIAFARRVISFYDHGTGGDKARAYLDEYYAGKNVELFHVIPTEEEGDAGDMSEEQIYHYLVKYLS